MTDQYSETTSKIIIAPKDEGKLTIHEAMGQVADFFLILTPKNGEMVWVIDSIKYDGELTVVGKLVKK